MADASKTVEIIFGGVDRTGQAVSSVGDNLKRLEDGVGSVTGPLANVTDSILKLDAALAAAAIGVTAYAVKISDDFDTAFGEIATLIGQPAENLRDFQAQILEYSERSSQSLQQITSATYSAISAGIEYQDSIELIAAAEQLAIAGRADLGATTTALVSTLNAFGASADQAGEYADTFFTAVQLGQTTIPELADTIGRLAPIAAAAGLSFDEMAAAIATITAETGTNTAEAITGIRAAINALLKPSKDAAGLASELGIEFSATALESKGFAGVLEDVREATGGSTELMARLFGSVEALAPVLALTGNASEAFADNIAAFNDNAGAAQTASQELTNSLGLLGQTLQNNVNSALIAFGSNLTDETRSAVNSMTDIFNSIGDEIRLDDGVFAPLIQGIETLAQDIDVKLRQIADNFPEALSGIDLSDLLSAFGDLGDELQEAVGNVFGEIDLGTVEGLEQALQRVVDAFTALVNISAGIIDGLQPLFTLVGEGIEQFENLDESTKRSVGELLGLGKAVDTVLPAVGALGGGLDAVGTGLTALAGASGFKTLITNLDSVKNIAAGAGRFGLVGAALLGSAGVGYGIGTLIQENIIEPIEDEFGQSIGGWLYQQLNADEIAQASAKWDGYASEVRRAAKDTQDINEINEILNRNLTDMQVATEEQQQSWQDYANELVNAAKSGGQFAENQEGIANAVGSLDEVIRSSGGALKDVSDNTRALADNNRSLQVGYDETTGKINSFSGTVIKSADALDDAAEKTKKVTEESEEYRLKLLDIASDERIASIEASVSLDIAEVEAGAQKVEALAESISDTFSSTGDLIGNLFGAYSEAGNYDQLAIARQIELENERRDRALALQEELTEAQIAQIEERTRAIAEGDGLMKIELADSVTPALELVLREILDKTRVWASEDAQNFLTGGV